MAGFREIEQGFVTQIDALNLGVPMGYPNKDIAEPPDGLWIQQFNIPALSFPATLGPGGWDNNPGVYQIDISTKRETGTGEILAMVDTVCSAFPAGKKFQEGDAQIYIEATSRTPGRKAGGFYRISVSLEYFARTKRIV